MVANCERIPTRWVNRIGLGLIALLVLFAYFPTLRWMYDRYVGEDSYYSHGFFIPLVSCFFIFQLHERLRQEEQTSALSGLILLLVALALHLLGTLLYIFSVSGFSLFFLIIGLSLYLFGWNITRLIWFPLVFLIFMFPLPMAIIGLVSFPLKLFTAKMGVLAVSLLGIPVHGEGFNITIPAGQLLVGNPCSGLRSLIAFLALGAVLTHISGLSPVKSLLLFVGSIPIAVVCNLIRVAMLILISHYYGLEAAAPDTLVHNGSGVLVFVLGFVLLMACAKVLEWRN